MRARLAGLSPRAKIALAAAAVLVYALAVWLLVVAPKRTEASSLASDVAAAEAQLVQARAGATPGRRPQATPAADVVRLSKAMPPSSDQAGLVLELSRLGRQSNLSITSITLDDPTTDSSGATVVPVTVVVTGTYRQVTRFLRNARTLVSFHGGKLNARGRLFTVTGIELAESGTKKFPFLDATVALDAYAYDGPLPAPAPVAPPASQDSSTTGATASGATG